MIFFVYQQRAECNSTFPFYQICECEGLQETIVSLKQQLSDVLELRNLSPLPGYSQRFSELKSFHAHHQVEKEIAVTKDRNKDLLRQAQVCS